MDEYRSRLREMLVAMPGGMKAASLAVGKNEAYMQQFIERNKPQILPEIVRRKLAAYLKMTPEELEQPELALNREEERPRSFPLVKMPIGLPGQKDLPVLGEAVGGDSGEFVLNGTVNEMIVRPEQLVSVQNAYALYVVGDSMEPVALNGQIAYVNPNRPPSPGGLVVCELQDGTAMIKTLVRRKADSVVLRQYNPARDFEIDRKKIKNLHRIILHGDAT